MTIPPGEGPQLTGEIDPPKTLEERILELPTSPQEAAYRLEFERVCAESVERFGEASEPVLIYTQAIERAKEAAAQAPTRDEYARKLVGNDPVARFLLDNPIPLSILWENEPGMPSSAWQAAEELPNPTDFIRRIQKLEKQFAEDTYMASYLTISIRPLVQEQHRVGLSRWLNNPKERMVGWYIWGAVAWGERFVGALDLLQDSLEFPGVPRSEVEAKRQELAQRQQQAWNHRRPGAYSDER